MFPGDRRVGLFCVLYEIAKQRKHDPVVHSTIKQVHFHAAPSNSSR